MNLIVKIGDVDQASIQQALGHLQTMLELGPVTYEKRWPLRDDSGAWVGQAEFETGDV